MSMKGSALRTVDPEQQDLDLLRRGGPALAQLHLEQQHAFMKDMSAQLSKCCWQPLCIPVETPTEVRGGCSRVKVPPALTIASTSSLDAPPTLWNRSTSLVYM